MSKHTSKYRQISLQKIKTISILSRKSKVQPKDFARVFSSRSNSFDSFLDSFPQILMGEQLREFVTDVITSRKNNFPVILMMGAHIIKTGLSPLVIDLIERGIITAVAMNSAAAIHDVETALWGQTSEDVAVNLLDGTFGMSKETGEFINGVLADNFKRTDCGYGESLGVMLQKNKAKNIRYSILANCVQNKIPVTVHAAIGTDIIHQQPTMNGAATGEMSFRDFKIFAHSVKELSSGGVVMNWGSAVILPEIFLKALTIVRNLGNAASGFTTANFDMNAHYRPMQNVVVRPTQDGGQGFYFIGHHEIMFPLVAAMIKHKLHATGKKRK
jgi:hypothetical protein